VNPGHWRHGSQWVSALLSISPLFTQLQDQDDQGNAEAKKKDEKAAFEAERAEIDVCGDAHDQLPAWQGKTTNTIVGAHHVRCCAGGRAPCCP
jgi:hypothetical protein